MARRPLIPLTVVTGPRGAGKTTLINRLLADPDLAATAVILNDFGVTELRGAQVERIGAEMVALGAGCVCCAVRGELTDTLERLLRDLDNGRLAELRRVVIEAEETADPAAIVAAIGRDPYLPMRYRPDGIIAVLGADALADCLAMRRETIRQVAVADAVVVAGALRPADAALLAWLNPGALQADAATVSPTALANLGPLGSPATHLPEPTERPGGLGGELAGLNIFGVARARTIPLLALDRFLDYLGALQAQHLIRVRGEAASPDGERFSVDGMGGLFWPARPIAGDGPTGIRFHVVASGLDQRTFETYLDAFLNEAQIDTPDRTALTDSPLTIAGFSARSGR